MMTILIQEAGAEKGLQVTLYWLCGAIVLAAVGAFIYITFLRWLKKN